MRLCVLCCAVVSLSCLSAGDPEVTAEHIANLIRHLGHEEFSQREAASQQLDAIGVPALDALKQAGADPDPEIRRRAGQVVQSITNRLRAAAAKKELDRFQGNWHSGGQVLFIKGDRWLWGTAGKSTPDEAKINEIKIVEVGEKATAADLLVGERNLERQVCKAIFHLDGDTLRYCGSYAARPVRFGEPGATTVEWKRLKGALAQAPPAKIVPQGPEVQFVSDAFSLDLPLAETKAPVHQILLNGRLADGGSVKLTLDPNVPKLDAFGEAVARGNQAPVLTLECTLKFVKKEKDRQLWELRGPKLVSRLSLVSFSRDVPWGDARLLVRDGRGEVRYAVSLIDRSQRHPPCHPGCFPAGTLVRVPTGTKRIEQLLEGDVVTTVDADGKRSTAKVTGVFATRNRLLELRTEAGTLVTTETQPIALGAGGFRAAGELQAGDKVWRWAGMERKEATVRAVTPPNREAEVFNLILGAPTAFIAGDFVVRSKPPAPRPGVGEVVP